MAGDPVARRFPLIASVSAVCAVVTAALVCAPSASSDPTDRAIVVDGENRLGFELMGAVRRSNTSDNLVVSPFTVAQTMEAVAVAGRGVTRSEVLTTLHIPTRLSLTRVMDASRNLREELEGDIAISNVIVRDKGLAVTPAYQKLLQEIAGQRLLSVDLGAPDQARSDINSTVAGLTKRTVTDLLAEGSPPPNARLIAGGAFGYKAEWVEKFASGGDLSFRRTDGKTVSARRLATGQGGAQVGYRRASDFQAVIIPYRGARLALLLLVPDAGAFASVENRLSASEVFETLIQARRRIVNLEFPAFRIGTRIESLADAISGFGATAAFSRRTADLSVLSSSKPLAFDAVIQQAVVTAEGGGTDDVAGAAGIRGGTAEASLSIDRPFLFAVVDRPTNALLALGRVVDPTQP